jgi:hypothetical protein
LRPLQSWESQSSWLYGDAIELISGGSAKQVNSYERGGERWASNGVPFASPNALFNISKLSVWWLRLGIAIERIKPGKPHRNGRHERMHLTLKTETTRPPGINSLQQQTRFDAFRQEFNTERPREALAMKCLDEIYSTPNKALRRFARHCIPLPRPRRPRHRLRPHLHASKEDQHIHRACRPTRVPLPAVSSLGGFRTPAPGVPGSLCEGPASETLHKSRPSESLLAHYDRLFQIRSL